LAQVGTTIFGEHWRAHLAHAFGVTPQTMSRWLAGSVRNKYIYGLLIDVLSRASGERREGTAATRSSTSSSATS
jgi:hypothetical protein